MNAKEIAERTLELAKDATPGEWQCDPSAGSSLLVATTVLGSGIMAKGWGSSDRVREARANEGYMAHASPQNMQTLANAYLDSVEREKKLLDAFEQWSSEIRPLTHKLGEALQALDEHQEGSGE